MRFLIATDTGGTFTDVAVYDRQTDKVTYGKTLTDYTNLIDGVLEGLKNTDAKLEETLVFKHGTTYVINTLLQRSGAKSALITTKGFGDSLEIGRGNRPIPFAMEYRRDRPLIDRKSRIEVKERIDYAGKVLVPLDLEQVRQIAQELKQEGYEAVAVSFINSYANPDHEEKTVALLRQLLPGVYVTCGTALTREWFEYERTSTAVANAYVGSRMSSYIDTFEMRLRERGFVGAFYMMGSNGGILSKGRAVEQPVALVESGPIGGCIGAAAYAKALNLSKVIAFDMGGTTAKCALVQDGRYEVQPVYYVGGYEYGFPLKTPVLDIIEVGAGGGSIASVDDSGRLTVGPHSAGSEPGPVAFGRGGIKPTVTDANLVLGRISMGSFLQGKLKLDRLAAFNAIRDNIAQPLGYQGDEGVDMAAQGILDLAAATMAGVIKQITIERGHDVREFVLFTFGGGGPLFASILARQLRIPKVIIPPHPGNFSTLGMLTAGARIDLSRMVVTEISTSALVKVVETFTTLEREARQTMKIELGVVNIRFDRSLEMRYRGQKHTVRVPFELGMDMDSVNEAFQQAYVVRFGHANNSPVEILEVRLGVEADVPAPELFNLTTNDKLADAKPKPSCRREIFFPKPFGRIEVDVWQRDTLPIGFVILGPAVVEEFSSTTILMPGDKGTVCNLGEIFIEWTVKEGDTT